MFAEAIPGVIIQLSAILSDGQVSSAAFVSLAISALTTGFISASISYDWDTDVKRRELTPEFYGYVPNHAKKRACKLFFSFYSPFCSFLLLLFVQKTKRFAYDLFKSALTRTANYPPFCVFVFLYLVFSHFLYIDGAQLDDVTCENSSLGIARTSVAGVSDNLPWG